MKYCDFLNFEPAPRYFWKIFDNQKKYLGWLSQKLGYTYVDDWYNLTYALLTKNNGASIYKQYNSIVSILQAHFPNQQWHEWKFLSVRPNFWQNKDNRVRYMNWLGEQLGFKVIEDWYKITKKDYENNCGSGMLSSYYKNSINAPVRDVFDQYDWKEWKFNQVTRGYWNNLNNQYDCINWIVKELNIETMEDWYKVQGQDIEKTCGSLLNDKSKSKLLIALYPHYNWDISKFDVVPQGLGTVANKSTEI